MNTNVHELIVRGRQYLVERDYKWQTQRIYHHVWDRFERFCYETGHLEPKKADGVSFLADRGIAPDSPLTNWQRQQIRIVNCLFDIRETGECPINYDHKVKRFLLPECFGHVHEAYCDYLETRTLAARTVYHKSHLARKFLNYVDSVGINEIKDVRAKDIQEYLSMLTSPRTNTCVKFFLREFLRFLVEEFGANSDLANLFPVILESKKSTLPSVYSAGELREAFNRLNADSLCAKRDRAILLFALQLGMRIGDIKKLKYEHIDWRLRTLSFPQQKTGRKIVLPLPDECVYALLDYLKNERPEVEVPQIFLTSRAPYKPLSDYDSCYRVISGCYERAGVNTKRKHRGMHSVRHSVAVNMLLSDTPYPVITAVLGHESSNTTKAYLGVDVERLRTLSLEVPHDC